MMTVLRATSDLRGRIGAGAIVRTCSVRYMATGLRIRVAGIAVETGLRIRAAAVIGPM